MHFLLYTSEISTHWDVFCWITLIIKSGNMVDVQPSVSLLKGNNLKSFFPVWCHNSLPFSDGSFLPKLVELFSYWGFGDSQRVSLLLHLEKTFHHPLLTGLNWFHLHINGVSQPARVGKKFTLGTCCLNASWCSWHPPPLILQDLTSRSVPILPQASFYLSTAVCYVQGFGGNTRLFVETHAVHPSFLRRVSSKIIFVAVRWS